MSFFAFKTREVILYHLFCCRVLTRSSYPPLLIYSPRYHRRALESVQFTTPLLIMQCRQQLLLSGPVSPNVVHTTLVTDPVQKIVSLFVCIAELWLRDFALIFTLGIGAVLFDC